jgi:ABC-type antimicrobial peptide transport system permease subunit
VRVVEIVLGGIGVIALAIAALGIANALLAAVRERRREIGVLKAVGARDRDVLRTFLIEAGVMGALGGLIGSILGLAVARAVAAVVDGYLTSQGLAGVQVGMPYRLGLAAVAGSVVLALLGGALPARRAARLPAREAVEL